MEFISNIHVQFYLIAFFVGGIPFGWIITYLLTGSDIRKEGSGSIGATNVLRVLKTKKDSVLAKKAALFTLILDASKGATVLLVAMMMGLPDQTLWAIAFLSVVGHCFSPYLLFEGGKGVATAFGVLLVLLPVEALVGLLGWFIAGKVLKISSVSSLIGLIFSLLASYILHPEIPIVQTHVPVVLIAMIITYKHFPNIIRLFQNREQPVL